MGLSIVAAKVSYNVLVVTKCNLTELPVDHGQSREICKKQEKYSKKKVIVFTVQSLIQWYLDLTKCQGSGKLGLLNRGFIILRFIFHVFYCDLNSLG